jgi:dihydrolipoamide dehydrogenase
LISTSNDQYLAEYLILATGSEPKTLPAISFDGVNILSSRDILSMKNLPESLAVIGGGVIGCEFASIFQQLGVKIQIIEFLPDLIAQEDSEISKRLLMMMKKKKIKVHTSSKVEYIDQQDDKLILNLSNGKSLESEKVLLCVGRKPVCDIVFEGVELLQENGSVTIDNMMRTNIQKVFAIGDLTGKLMLAHTAGRQALLVAEVIKADIEGDEKEFEVINYDNIPRCTFTNPAIGSVGLTEDQAKKLYGDIKVGKFMFSANGKALAGGVSEGFVKVVIEQKSGRLRGMHIIGPEAAELIAQGSAMINLSADIKSLQKVVYAHPTLSECVGEAIEDCQNLAVHKI